MKRMWDIWMLQYPTSTKTAKQLVTQCSNIRKNNLLAPSCYGKGEPGQPVNAGVSSTPPNNEIEYQAPRTTATLNINECNSHPTYARL